ncbi:MAG: sulfite exporter TauE/SafE family protein [Pseudomonadota bacterium]
MTDPAIAALICLAFLTAGLIKGVIGLGMPVVVLAFLATTIGLKPTLALMVFPGIIGNLWQATTGGAFWSNLSRLWSMFALSVAAIWIGVATLAAVEVRWITALLGLILSAYAALSLWKPRLPPPRQWEIWLSPTIGAVAGFMFGLTGTYMVPGVIYIEALGLQRDAFVQALGMTFLIISATLGASLVQHDLMSAKVTLASALALVPLFTGLLVGQRVRRHVPQDKFRKLFFIWLFITGFVIFGRAAF